MEDPRWLNPSCTSMVLWSTGSMKQRSHWMLGTDAGVRVKALLLTHPAFQKEPHMVSDTLKLLEWIADRTIGAEKGEDDWGVPTKKFQNAFRKGRQRHTAFKAALVDLGVVKMTKQYVAPGPVTKGAVARYSLNPTFKEAYLEAAASWTPPPEDRGKLVRKRGRRIREAQAILDPFSRTHEILSCLVEMDWDAVPKSGERLAIAKAIMGKLERVEFERIENDGESSRLYHPLGNMPKDFRKGLRAAGKVYCGEVDVRACWPTFLAAQLRALNRDTSEAFKAEYKAWTDAFCDEKKDPRETILLETGLPIKPSEMKECLNKYLNGSLQAALKNRRKVSPRYAALERWFASRYPLMHKAWEATGPSNLAYKIGLNFETPLMTDPRLYEFAEKNEVKFFYQYDGFGVFAKPGSQEALEAVLAGLCRLMRDISTEKFGVPIVVKRQIMAL
jgi:hypothetical protein